MAIFIDSSFAFIGVAVGLAYVLILSE